MIKLVVLDVDGTSIDRDNHFYDDDIKEIDFYKEKGIEFMFASGRDMNMMLDMIKKSHVDGDLIINNGTQYRNIEGTRNIAHPMDEDAFRKMIPILQKYNYHISIHTTKGKYILGYFRNNRTVLVSNISFEYYMAYNHENDLCRDYSIKCLFYQRYKKNIKYLE